MRIVLLPMKPQNHNNNHHSVYYVKQTSPLAHLIGMNREQNACGLFYLIDIVLLILVVVVCLGGLENNVDWV